ncbi:uncharacterized protein KIAA0895-like homolog isoform X2 [Choloepus didactylus]|uniref:uncharacterized protein KIAA0895-like homolog isoform X2 n=1 Tax=Choloepus didactylus TaxID=27675 RepID=UPI00189DBD36|nr:uncharacterized protein KIAA0895-like homolog isoform X2 [Choloepus didactylus]
MCRRRLRSPGSDCASTYPSIGSRVECVPKYPNSCPHLCGLRPHISVRAVSLCRHRPQRELRVAHEALKHPWSSMRGRAWEEVPAQGRGRGEDTAPLALPCPAPAVVSGARRHGDRREPARLRVGVRAPECVPCRRRLPRTGSAATCIAEQGRRRGVDRWRSSRDGGGTPTQAPAVTARGGGEACLGTGEPLDAGRLSGGGTHYLRGANNAKQPWHSAEGRLQYGLRPANPTEEGLASLHSVLFRKQPFLWRAALLYYTIHRAARMSFHQLFHDLARYVQSADVRWEYCVRAKRGQTDTSQPGCFSKDQVYLDGIVRILRHRQTIDFPLLTSLGKVSYEDVDHLRPHGVLNKTRVPHFMQDLARYRQQLEHIMATNRLDEAELGRLLPD